MKKKLLSTTQIAAFAVLAMLFVIGCGTDEGQHLSSGTQDSQTEQSESDSGQNTDDTSTTDPVEAPPTPTPEPTATATPEPTATPLPKPTATPLPKPTATPVKESPTPTAPPVSEPDLDIDTDIYLELSEDEAVQLAKENGLESRVVRIDDEHFPMTMDYMPTRLNFEIDNGEVTLVTIG